jgi:DedD protein
MRLVLEQRTKHRLAGVLVVMSLAVIFLPVMIKKSSLRLEESMHVSIKLPSKPLPPELNIPSQKDLRKSVKVARIDIPKISPVTPVTAIAKAEPLRQNPLVSEVVKAPVIASTINASTPAAIKPLALNKKSLVKTKALAATPKPVAHLTSKSVKRVALVNPKKSAYGVQLAYFAQPMNAQLLVARLRNQGYSANLSKITNGRGTFYKVVVGQLTQKNQALSLKKKLAENMRIDGFIIKTQVS